MVILVKWCIFYGEITSVASIYNRISSNFVSVIDINTSFHIQVNEIAWNTTGELFFLTTGNG